VLYKGCPAPFSKGIETLVTLQLCPQPLIFKPKGAPRLSKVGIIVLCFFSKHPQQIKCTPCVGLELATVQLICGILSRCLLPQSTQLASTMAFQAGEHISHARMHILLFSVLPFLLELYTLLQLWN
jgi:hypothetical protein